MRWQRINTYVHEQKLPSYNINLDPAVTKVPYGCNIDIRDTVNYKEVQYGHLRLCLRPFPAMAHR